VEKEDGRCWKRCRKTGWWRSVAPGRRDRGEKREEREASDAREAGKGDAIERFGGLVTIEVGLCDHGWSGGASMAERTRQRNWRRRLCSSGWKGVRRDGRKLKLKAEYYGAFKDG
jgi:hypothetical protein